MTQKPPILTLGNYQLVYRPDDEHTELKQSLDNKPFLLFLIGIPAGIGVMVALLAFFKQALTMIGVPLSVIFGLTFALLCLFSDNIILFILKFKVINTKQQSTTNTTKKPFGIFDWLVICVLSILSCLLFYLYVYAKLPSDAYELTLLKIAIIIIATPYYLYRVIRLCKMLFV